MESFEETAGSILPRMVYDLYHPRCIREQLIPYVIDALRANTFKELIEKGCVRLYFSKLLLLF